MNEHAEGQREAIEKQVADNPVRKPADYLESQNGGRSIKSLLDEYDRHLINDGQKIYLDITARKMGFADTDAMMKAIRKLKPADAEIADRIEQAKRNWLRSEIGLDGNESAQAVHNTARLKSQSMEAEMLRQMIRDKIDKSAKDNNFKQRETDYNKRWKDAEQKLIGEYDNAKNKELQQKLADLDKQHKEELTQLGKEADYNKRWADAEAWSQKKKEQMARSAEIGINAARDYAKKRIENKPATEAIDWRRQFMLEGRSRAQAEKLANKGDYEGALKSKNAEMINHAMGVEGIKAEREYRQTQKFLDKFVKRGDNLMGMRSDFAYQIDKVLQQVGLRKEDPVLPEGQFAHEPIFSFLTRLEGEYVNPVVPDSIIAGPTDFGRMTMGEVRDLKTTVSSLSAVGKSIQKTLAGAVKQDLAILTNELAETAVNEIGIGKGDKGIGRKNEGLLEKISKATNPFEKLLSYVYPENICRLLDGGKDNGPWQRNVFRPVYDAVMDANRVSMETSKDIQALLTKHGFNMTDIVRMGKDMRTFDFAPTRKISMENIMMAALHWGNAEGRDRVIRSILFGSDPGMPISSKLSYVDLQRGTSAAMRMFRELTPLHAEFIKGFQIYLSESKWPDIRHQEIAINGFDPKKVEAVPWNLNGTEMPGGYAHIDYDPNKSSEAYYSAEMLNKTYAQFPGVRAATDKGHTMARVRAVNRDLNLDFQSQLAHLANVDYDLSMRKPIIDAARIMKTSDVRAAVENSLGQGYLRQMDQWLKNVAIDQRQPMNFGEKLLRNIQGNTTKFTLGLNVKALPDFLPNNIIQAMSQAGLDGAIASSKVTQYLYDSDFRDNIKSKSPMMAQRLVLNDKNISELSRTVLDGGLMAKLPKVIPAGLISKAGETSDMLTKASMSFHGVVDCMVSFPVWDQMYQKSIDAGMKDEDAIGLADSYVRRTMGDGSSAGQPLAMRDNSVAGRLMGMFLTYQIGQFNRFWFDSKLGGLEYSKGNYATGIGLMAKAVALGWLAPALWTSVVRVGLPVAGASLLATGISGQNQQGKMKNKDKLETYAVDATKYPFSGFRYFSAATQYAANQALGSDTHGLQMSPVEGTLEQSFKDLETVGKYLVKSGPKPVSGEQAAEAAGRMSSLAAGAPHRLDTWAFNYFDWLNKNGDKTVNQGIRDVFSREHKQQATR